MALVCVKTAGQIGQVRRIVDRECEVLESLLATWREREEAMIMIRLPQNRSDLVIARLFGFGKGHVCIDLFPLCDLLHNRST